MNLIELETLDIFKGGEYACTVGHLSISKIQHITTTPNSKLRKILEQVEKIKRDQREANR